MELSEVREKITIKSSKQLKLASNDFPLEVHFGETIYVLVMTKSKKLLLQKPLV